MRVVLKPKRARPFFGRHPWVFAGAIDAVEGDPADRDVVDLVSHTGNFVARGLFNSKSKIRVRLYCWEESRPIDADFFRDRLRFSIALRQQLGMMSPREACRLVSSEGDGLSGLTVDRYGTWLVMQFTSLALGLRRELLADLLQEMVQPEGIYLRTERGIGDLEGIALEDAPLRGQVPSGPLMIEENGLRFQVNIAEGQKTGYYLDQRDNRLEAAKLAPGRRVLDAFCYTGGFALQAARAGAVEVIGVDGSESALALARLNAVNNGLDQRVKFHQEDVFQDLDRRVRQGERFGLVILDPPKFARRKGSVEDALRGYRRLQSLALKLLEPGGFLVSCCCSGLITLAMLEELMAQVAAEARRDIQLLQRRGPSPDHPVSVACLESHYLKCLLTRVG